MLSGYYNSNSIYNKHIIRVNISYLVLSTIFVLFGSRYVKLIKAYHTFRLMYHKGPYGPNNQYRKSNMSKSCPSQYITSQGISGDQARYPNPLNYINWF